MNNEGLFCIYCDNILFPVKDDDDNKYILKCMNCDYIKDLPDNETTSLFRSSNQNISLSKSFDFDENDIIYDYSLQRYKEGDNEYVLLNDRNMRKIYIDVETKEIHINIVSHIKEDSKDSKNTFSIENLKELKKSLKTETDKTDKIESEPTKVKRERKTGKQKKETQTQQIEIISKSKQIEIEPKEDTKTDKIDRYTWPNDERDIFFFYSNSADKEPGKGSNEKLIDTTPNKYEELKKHKNWRKVLSNFWHADFKYNELTYHTAEHAFQGAKMGLANPLKGELFSVEKSGDSGIGSSTDGNVARSNRKLIKLNDKQLEKWENIKYNILEDILYAKFSQNELPRKILLATKDAILLHGTRGVTTTRQIELENVRLRLSTI